MMHDIARSVEADGDYFRRLHFTETLPDATTADALSHAANSVAKTIDAAKWLGGEMGGIALPALVSRAGDFPAPQAA